MSTKLNVDSIINESIKLEKLNKDVINTINNIAETKASDAVTPVANDVDTLIGDHVIGKGSAENSAVLKGGNNTVTGKYSAAIGYNTIAKNVGEHASGIYNVSNSDTQFSIGIGTSDSNRKNAFEVKQNGDIYAYNYKLATGCINVTHEELVNLRKNNRLIPGQQYRIIDYVTVSNQKDTIADGRQFDIIVTADDESTLNENARAIHHDGCDDFKDDNLAAWELKYTLTNDDYLYYWGNSGDRIESIEEDFYDEFEIVSVNGDKIEYGWTDDSYGEYTIDKSKTYNIQGNEYYRTIESKYHYVPVNYTEDSWLYYYDRYENIDPSFIVTDKLITLCGNNYYRLDKYIDYYVSTDYNNDKSIYEYQYEFWSEYEILSINGDKIEYGYEGEEPSGEYTIDKSKTYNIESNEYYKVVEYEYYYVPVNYSVGDSVYYFDESIYDNYSITNIVNTPSTKGTIYYMKDEHNNECPYDFKCIKFLEGIDYIYTFGDGCYDNHINPHMINNLYYELNSITFGNNCYNNSFGDNCYGNSFSYGCYGNSFGNNCYNNSFGNNCYNNSFGDNCYGNSFGYRCYGNSFGYGCYGNSFGNNCYNNSFGNSCYNNSFSYNCSSNSFRNSCYNNRLGHDCAYNKFGNSCYSNSFDYACYSHSFGNSCYNNRFGNNCSGNSFGNTCTYNSFGNSCRYNSFGNDCYYNSFRLGSSINDTLLEYCYYNHFDDGCSYNVIWNSVQPTDSNKLQNINVVRGVSGKSSKYNFINIVDKNATHEIKVAKNSKGDIKVYCEADLTKLLSSLDSDGCLTLYHE